MVLLHDCIPCQYGDHSGHMEVTQAVPEGMIGGARCPCTGDCAERNPQQPLVFSNSPMPDMTEWNALMDRMASAAPDEGGHDER